MNLSKSQFDLRLSDIQSHYQTNLAKFKIKLLLIINSAIVKAQYRSWLVLKNLF